MTPREATAADLPAIARLHAESWQAAYRGILPDAYLEAAAPAMLAARWTPARLAAGWVLVLDAAAGITGFVAHERRPEGPFLDNLHVRPRSTGQGAGRCLMAALAQRLLAAGDTRLTLEVLAENASARAFYRALGGREGPEREARLWDGTPVRELEVRWDGLAGLAGKLPRSGAMALDGSGTCP